MIGTTTITKLQNYGTEIKKIVAQQNVKVLKENTYKLLSCHITTDITRKAK